MILMEWWHWNQISGSPLMRDGKCGVNEMHTVVFKSFSLN